MRKRVMALCLTLAMCSNATIINAEESPLAIGEYTQEDVESMMGRFVAAAYNATSGIETEKAADELKNIMTEDEIATLKEELGYNCNKYEVLESKTYFVSAENSYDGRKHEYLDFKVGNDEINYMYLIEFTVNGEEKVFNHTIWRH